MERKTRLWLGLGAAVLVGSSTASSTLANAAELLAAGQAPGGDRSRGGAAATPVVLAQSGEVFEGGEGGEGEGGEGGGQILGTITEFRLTSIDPNAFQYDASQQVAAYGAVVHERYAATHAAAVEMQEAVAALLDDPTEETLASAREAWIAARTAYMQTEPFLFYAGPIDGLGGPIKRINSWPIDPGFIDYTAANPEGGLVNDPSVTINRATLVRLDQAGGETEITTGWHAIEFLLWGEDLDASGPGARPASDYIAGEENTDRRRDYLRVVTQLLVLDLSTLVAAWAPDANNYRASLVAMDQRNAIGRAFNGMAVLAGYEMGLKRIGAGLRRGAEFEQSPFSDNTTADNLADLQGIRDVYFGNADGFEGAGFDTLLAGIDPELNDRVIAALDRADAAIAALDTPYDSILVEPPDSPARAEAAEAVEALKDLAVALRAAGNRLGVLVLIPGI